MTYLDRMGVGEVTAFTFEVLVSLKPGLLDPQGKAVEGSLPAMGFDGVDDVRVGKHIKLTVEAPDEAARPRRSTRWRPGAVEPGDRGLRGARGGGRVTDRLPRIGVVTFPGSLDDATRCRAIEAMGGEARGPVARRPRPRRRRRGRAARRVQLRRLPPVRRDRRAGADHGRGSRRSPGRGGPVLGICNGFQVLCEAGLLPGALIRNASLRFVCEDVWLRVETAQTCVTRDLTPGEIVQIPVKHGEGQWVATPEQLERVEGDGLVVFRYCGRDGVLSDAANPNGATNHIAGVRNDAGNVVGLMPHPEHAVDPDVGPTGGQPLFASLLETALAGVRRREANRSTGSSASATTSTSGSWRRSGASRTAPSSRCTR